MSMMQILLLLLRRIMLGTYFPAALTIACIIIRVSPHHIFYTSYPMVVILLKYILKFKTISCCYVQPRPCVGIYNKMTSGLIKKKKLGTKNYA